VVRGRADAAAVVLAAPARVAPSASSLRRSGVLRALLAYAFAALLFFVEHPIGSAVAGSIGTLTLLLALISPAGGYLRLQRAVEQLGELVGGLLTWLLLGPVFYLVLAPFGLLARRGKGDRVGRRFDRSVASYWIVRPERDAESTKAALEKPY
jgi:hypothetical protein